MSSVIEVANNLVDLCRQGRFMEALKYYADDAISVEAAAPADTSTVSEGIDAIRAKSEAWGAANEVHNIEVLGPFVGGTQFAVYFAFDITQKDTGQRMTLREMGLYDVSEGIITREEFFYNMPGL